MAKTYGQIEESEVGDIWTRDVHADEIGRERELLL